MDIQANTFSDPIYVQEGCSPLFLASANGHTEIVDILLKNGADLKLVITVWNLVLLLSCNAGM